MSEDDFVRAYLEYLQQRMTTLEAEIRETGAVMGESFGVEPLTPEDVTPEVYDRMTRAWVALIRRWGNALADRYEAIHARALHAMKEKARWLMVAQERSLTAAEGAQLDAAAAAYDEASEDIERLIRASGFLKGPGE